MTTEGAVYELRVRITSTSTGRADRADIALTES
jgi:hypothetical protein